MKTDLKQLFLSESANTIIDRLVMLIPEYKLKEILNPVIIGAKIVDQEAVINYIKTIWPFNIKDLELNLRDQTLDFKIFGNCYVPKKYSMFKVMRNAYSLEPTEENDTAHEIKEKYAEEVSISLVNVPGIELEYK